MKQSRLPWLVFNLDKGYYALNSSAISSIVELPKQITPLHNVPAYVCGLMNYRGRVIPLLDLRKLLALKTLEGDSIMARQSGHDRVIVIENNHMQMGVIVDDVNAVDAVSAVADENEIISLMQVDYIENVGRGNKIAELILMMNDSELFQLLNQQHVFEQAVEH